jgi:hypothetical protein
MLNVIRRRLKALGEYYLFIWTNPIIYYSIPICKPNFIHLKNRIMDK